MRSYLFLGICLTVHAFLQAQSAQAQQKSPKEIADQFCKLDASGNHLRSSGRKNFRRLFLDARTGGEDSDSEITIIKDCRLREIAVRGDIAELTVDYRVWGRLDSSLGFTRLQLPYSNQPLIESETISLVRSNTYYDLGSDGHWQQVKSTPEWRIKTSPHSSHVSVDVAMGYVRVESYKSNDPVFKANAQKTLMELQNLYQSEALGGHFQGPVQNSPVEILSQYAAMETDGTGLTPQGMRLLDAFLVRPMSWAQDKVHVAKDYRVKDAPSSRGKAELYVEYVAIGELDSSLRFTSVAPAANIVREKFQLLFDNTYSVPARGNMPAHQLIGPSRWRITAAPAERWLTVNSAMRYLEKVRDTATDSIVRQRAEDSLAILVRYR